jgi:hypothetical protein
MMSWKTGAAAVPPKLPSLGWSSTTYVRKRGLSAGANPANEIVRSPGA